MNYALKGNEDLIRLIYKLKGKSKEVLFPTWDVIEKTVFAVVDEQPEDLEHTLEHFPYEMIWIIAGRLGVLNTDIIGLVITELEPED